MNICKLVPSHSFPKLVDLVVIILSMEVPKSNKLKIESYLINICKVVRVQ